MKQHQIEAMFFNGNQSLCIQRPGAQVIKESPKRKESSDSETSSNSKDNKDSLTYHGGHHLLKTLMKFSVAQKVAHDRKTKQFINDYNLHEKNIPYKDIRQAYGVRRDDQLKQELQEEVTKRVSKKKKAMSVAGYMKNKGKLVSLKFDTPKEWILTRFLHEKLIKDIEEKIFQFHQT